MINARNLSQQLGGHWYGRYGTAPCPICQTERRKDQNALTLSDNENRLLAHCKKSGCDFHEDVLAYVANLQAFVAALTLPTSDGTSGQALVTNGSGTISFGSAGISTGKAIAMAIVFG